MAKISGSVLLNYIVSVGCIALRSLPCAFPTDLKPRGVAVNMIPGLVAHILFMCVRHADYLSDEGKLKSLMNAIVGGIKRVVMVRQRFVFPNYLLSSTDRLSGLSSQSY